MTDDIFTPMVDTRPPIRLSLRNGMWRAEAVRYQGEGSSVDLRAVAPTALDAMAELAHLSYREVLRLRAAAE